MENIARTLSESANARILSLEENFPPQPAIFLPIGSPALLIEDSAARTFIRELGMKYNVPKRRPACIICFSARWISPNEKIQIMSNPHPQTVHDFSNFADCLYEIVYSADGSVECAAKVAEAFSNANLEWEFDGSRGYDFGCWSPVALLFPDASVPLIQVSLHSSLDPTIHVAMGEALHSLREEGYLLLCLGGVTHNLLELSFSQMRPLPWAQVVDDWVSDVLLIPNAGDGDAVAPPDGSWEQLRNSRLATYDKHSDMLMKAIAQAHPTGAYLLPLHVAAGSGGPCTLLHRSWIYGNLSMSSYMFGSMPGTSPSPAAPPTAGAAPTSQPAAAEHPGLVSEEQAAGTSVLSRDGLESTAAVADAPTAAQESPLNTAAAAAGGDRADVGEVEMNVAGSRPRTSSRPASRELVALAAAAAALTDSQRFARQLQAQLGPAALNK